MTDTVIIDHYILGWGNKGDKKNFKDKAWHTYGTYQEVDGERAYLQIW